MSQRRLGVSDIVVGQPIQWDVTGDDGKLLLRKGQIIANERQIEALIERGLFVEGSGSGGSMSKESQPKEIETTSVVRLLNAAHKRLERLLYNLATEPDVLAKIMEVVNVIQNATAINPDIAHGCILLNQDFGHYAVRHCVDTGVLAFSVARAMQKTPEETSVLVAAALTMNVGMLRRQDAFQDRPDPVTPKDIESIKNHPEESVALLKQVGADNADWLAYVSAHHESGDASGYPLGANAVDVPQNAKILSMADRYCAAVSRRKYRRTLLPHLALRDVLVVDGKPRDPMLAAYFIKIIGNYPPGTFVRLQTEEVGVVIRRGESPTTPLVQALYNPRGVPLTIPVQRDTARPQFAIREPVQGDHKMLRFSLQQLWGKEAAL